jgi:hypothetical protein
LLAAAVVADARMLACWLEWIRALGDQERWGEADAALRAARRRFPAEPLLDREELRGQIKTGRLRGAAATARRLATEHPAWADMTSLADRLAATALASTRDAAACGRS